MHRIAHLLACGSRTAIVIGAGGLAVPTALAAAPATAQSPGDAGLMAPATPAAVVAPGTSAGEDAPAPDEIV